MVPPPASRTLEDAERDLKKAQDLQAASPDGTVPDQVGVLTRPYLLGVRKLLNIVFPPASHGHGDWVEDSHEIGGMCVEYHCHGDEHIYRADEAERKMQRTGIVSRDAFGPCLGGRSPMSGFSIRIASREFSIRRLFDAAVEVLFEKQNTDGKIQKGHEGKARDAIRERLEADIFSQRQADLPPMG